MPKVTPLAVSQLEAARAGELYLRSCRPPIDRVGSLSEEERREYRRRANLLHEKLAQMGIKKLVDADARQRRTIYVWIMERLPDGTRS